MVIVTMPCNVGDTVYVLMPNRYTFDGKRTRVTHWKVEAQTVTEISRKMGRSGKIGAWGIISAGNRRNFSTIGHTVFLDKATAEEMVGLLNGELPEGRDVTDTNVGHREDERCD